jgi:hypothetical protein
MARLDAHTMRIKIKKKIKKKKKIYRRGFGIGSLVALDVYQRWALGAGSGGLDRGLDRGRQRSRQRSTEVERGRER